MGDDVDDSAVLLVREERPPRQGQRRSSSRQAADNAAILVDGSGSLVPANWVLFDNAGFFLRSARMAACRHADLGLAFGFCSTAVRGIGGDCNGVPENVVRYDSPTFAGFSVSAVLG